ncbi:OmpA family protein [Flexithrix dorotheae]|uniref:OmpA family protein n=1 Tax=Flexithrix dorotheae TaxID=70993 RepID=UPI000371700B|nr:OmpA family protein [Flexithrix dorotheae]
MDSVAISLSLIFVFSLFFTSNPEKTLEESPSSNYTLTKTDGIYRLEGMFFNSDTKEPVSGVDVIITNINNDFTKTVSTDASGRFSAKLIDESVYAIVGVKPKYFHSPIKNVSTIGWDSEIKIHTNIPIKRIEKGRSYLIEQLDFEINDVNISNEKGFQKLDNLFEILRRNPDIILEIGVHTDSRGNDMYNLELSQERANMIANYLVSKGINNNRLKAIGYGETRPANHCTNNVKCSHAQHVKNRRTEFRVIEFEQ